MPVASANKASAAIFKHAVGNEREPRSILPLALDLRLPLFGGLSGDDQAPGLRANSADSGAGGKPQTSRGKDAKLFDLDLDHVAGTSAISIRGLGMRNPVVDE